MSEWRDRFGRRAYAAQWAEKGTLWTPGQERLLADEVMGALVDAHGPVRIDPPSGREVDGEPEDAREARRVSHIVHIGPPASEDLEFECFLCGARFETGRGCTACVAPVCVGCSLTHDHAADGTMGLREIGAVLGYSVERVRQIQETALEALRRGFRRNVPGYRRSYTTAGARLLRDFARDWQ